LTGGGRRDRIQLLSRLPVAVSGSGTFDVNGTITVATITGTYSENSHCAGSLKITPKGLSALSFNFVVVGAGSEILLLETDANTGVVGSMQQ
jgi:hypothetical protein